MLGQILTGQVSKPATMDKRIRRSHQRTVIRSLTHVILPIKNTDMRDCPQARQLARLQDLPNEVLVQIFCELPGDAYTMRSLLLTCRAWGTLLSMNQWYIGDSIADSRKGLLSILLKCSSPLRWIQSPLRWLGAAYRRAEKIELLLEVLDSIGAFRDEGSWRLGRLHVESMFVFRVFLLRGSRNLLCSKP